MAELLQSRESTAENRQASSSLNQLLHGSSSSQRRGFQVRGPAHMQPQPFAAEPAPQPQPTW